MNPLVIGILIVVGIVALIVLFVTGQYIALWFQALISGAPVGFLDLIMMRFRKVRPQEIVFNRISAKKAGLELPTDYLESHYLAGGRVTNVILDAVRTSVDPKVIDCPSASAGKTTIDAVAKDGIQLRAKARVTVRANLARLVGGATEETIIARVGEGIVSAIGSATSHKEVLENPDKISKAVLAKGLDSGTAFEILSIDIADVDVGVNIGAKLQGDQAEADKARFQAEAEKRRAMAVAQEAEYHAEVQKNRALVVLAEAEVPKAMAEAFRKGHLGIMDYYRMRNVVADTSMRESIAGDDATGGKST
jgi:uncharacterized protein YqfA (UPF0365 family)